MTRFDAVAIGASAGGIPALRAVLTTLPAPFAAAVFVVQHLDPRHRSMLAEVLGRESALPVKVGIDEELVHPGTVYVASPDMHLVVEDAHVRLTQSKPIHFSRPSIDVLFASIAKGYGQHAIAVILSGTGTDGADGVRAIKAAGGTTIALDPRRAEHSTMPQAAVASGAVDLVLPLEEIGPALTRLVTRDSGAGVGASSV
jgi:two-component system chemotaxis response regulator CheB